MQSIKNTFNRFSLDQKVLTLICIEIIGFCIVGLVAISQLSKVGEQVEHIAGVTLPLHLSIENLHSQILVQQRNVRDILISSRVDEGDGASKVNALLRIGEKEVSTNIEFAEKFIRKLVAQQNVNENVFFFNSENLLQALFNLRRVTLMHNGLVTKVLQQILIESTSDKVSVLSQIAASEDDVMENLSQLRQRLDVIRVESTRHAIYVKRIAIGFIVLTLLAAIAFFIAMLLLIVRRNISKPLQLLTDTINTFTAMIRVEESEFEKGLMLRRDELGRMSRSFNRLKHDLWSQGQDLHDAKEEAERANRAKSMFLASASHDLRQPLHAMQMYIAALRQKVAEPSVVAMVDDIDAVSISTGRLLSALLDVSQLEAGAIEPNFEVFPIEDVLNRVVREFGPVAKQKNLDFRLIPSSMAVRSDPVLLERILGNFLSNAIRYTQQGRILIGVRLRGEQVSIEVWDTGRGIPDDQTLAIFEDFHQIDNEERDRSKGLGLGLAIAKRLAACLSHKIECNSIVGRGSRFAVLVAAAGRHTEKVEKVDPIEKLIHGLAGTRVLLIEDDMEVSRATQRLLESWGCEVLTGCNLDEVMTLVKTHMSTPPEMIIADNRLPGEAEGAVVATKVQEYFGYTIPTVVVTGDVQEEHIRDISRHGYKLLFKPVQPAKLRALISNMTGSSVNKQ